MNYYIARATGKHTSIIEPIHKYVFWPCNGVDNGLMFGMTVSVCLLFIAHSETFVKLPCNVAVYYIYEHYG